MDPDAREPGGHPLGPVPELAEGQDLVVGVDQHRMVGGRVGAALHELPHGACSGEDLVGRHLVSFWPRLIAVPDASRMRRGNVGTI